MQRSVPHRCTAAAAAITLTLALSSCGAKHDPAEDMTFNGSYHMIEGGTSVLIEDTATNVRSSLIYFPEDMETVYGQTALSAEEKKIYDSLVKAIGDEEPSVPMEADGETYTKILNLIGIEQMGFGNVSDRRVGEFNVESQHFPVEFTYRFSCEEMSNMNRAAEAAANEIMLGVTDEMTTYDKLKYFHDYLITHCESDSEDAYANTIYGALVRGKALCEGYAKSFSYLCNKAGIENIIVTGETDTAHMWNMVKIDGNWYHVDVTWDKPDGTIAEMYPDMVMYQYFLVTDSVIENNHTIWTITTPPPVGDRFALAGRVWEVEELDIARKLIYVKAVKGKMEVSWPGDYGEIHTKILERMKKVLEEDTVYPYLKPNARHRLEVARNLARNTGMTKHSLVSLGGYTWCLFPWLGTRSFRTLRKFITHNSARYKITNMEFEGCYYMMFKMEHASDYEFIKGLCDTAMNEGIDKSKLVNVNEMPVFEKYDDFIPAELLRRQYAADKLRTDEIMTRLPGILAEYEDNA